ncbi:MAG: prolyl oligopeptidase family serine peptidase, partial [Bacteroidota bacterium]
ISDRKSLNNGVYVTDTSKVEAKHWKPLIKPRKNVLINGLEVFDKYLVLSEKANTQNRIRVINQEKEEEHYIEFKEDFYDIGIGYNPDTNTDTLQISFTSFITPSRVINYNMKTRKKRTVKSERRTINYFGKHEIKQEWATAADGTKVPITLIYNKWSVNRPSETNKRVYLTSYGAYGAGETVGYSQFVQNLLFKGFVYAIAHVRGGDDLGMEWYHDGKMMNKRNTFTDFISCAERLIELGYAEKGSITASGGSAGGLLMGAVANMRPELFKGIFLEVPFVDVMNTMLDEKLPLTTSEYLEWGNPNIKKHFEYMLSYSPYENVKAQDYPNLYFFTGLNDTRVGYWEAAKMVAKLRATKTDDNLLLLKTNLYGGHGGGSGRYAWIDDASYKLALIFDLYGKK